MHFTRQQRLITKAEFKSVFDQSNKTTQRHFLALFKPNQKPYARLGLVIGKRVANTAISRNRIKRVIRESFRLNQEQLKGLDIVIIGRQQCDTLDKTKLREGIEKLWEKLKNKLSNVIALIIRTYQYLISPLFGNCCRFYPSCSSYAIEAFRLHGYLRGSYLTFKRILRCHPWHPGGIDLVPERNSTC